MRLVSLSLRGFRGFASSATIDLEADAVVIVGANGNGKTSIFDAILWSLTGQVPRLSKTHSDLICLYSESGEASVTLTLRTVEGRGLKVSRRCDRDAQYLQIEDDDGNVLREAGAQSRLYDLLWPEALVAPDGIDAITNAITRSVYLQQDLVRQFVEADSDEDRFGAISELVGAGRVTELQSQLERSKRNWTQATNVKTREVDSAREKVQALTAQLARMSNESGNGDGGDLDTEWAHWWDRAIAAGVVVHVRERPSSGEASTLLDSLIKQVTEARRALARQEAELSTLSRDPQQSDGAAERVVAQLRERVAAKELEFKSFVQSLEQAEAQAAEARKYQTELRQTNEELAALARLALRHLGDVCPVCSQTFDITATRDRLETSIAAVSAPKSAEVVAPAVTDLAARVAEADKALASLRRELQGAEQRVAELRKRESLFRARLKELGHSAEDTSVADSASLLAASIQQAAERSSALASLQRDGEGLALSLAQAGEADRRREYQVSLELIAKTTLGLASDVAMREATGVVAQQIIDGLREASAAIVEQQLERIAPLLQRIYARVDPHPALRLVKVLSTFHRGRGRLTTSLHDDIGGKATGNPAVVLSSSQLNVLAVSMFLSFNLGLPRTPIAACILDDPLQSLDDVNLLGLVDLLRRTKDRRQLIISTHDARFGKLLARKLRPVTKRGRTLVVELEGWSRTGPQVHQHEVEADVGGLRVVA